MSISRQQEEQMLCQDYFDAETKQFTSRGNITEEDIFESADSNIKSFFVSHYANLPKCQEQAERGEQDILIGELSGCFETPIDERSYSNIVRTYNRNTITDSEFKRQSQDNLVSLLKKINFSIQHYDEPQDQFMWHLASRRAKGTLKPKHSYMAYQLLHKKFGMKPRKAQMFNKALKPFIDKEQNRLEQLRNDKA